MLTTTMRWGLIGWAVLALSACGGSGGGGGGGSTTPTPSDTALPTVTGISNADGATIAPGDSIEITFSEAMDTGSLALSGDMAAMAHTIAWTFGNTVLAISPNPTWTAGLDKTLILNVTDAVGNALAQYALTYDIVDGTAPLVTIQNVRNNGVIHSGFLIGTMADGATVTVSLDLGPYVAATLTSATTWKFPLPIPSSGTIWLDNFQHTVAVQSSDTATAGPVTFRKGVNNDVNGDGYADLAVGAKAASSNVGAAYVFHGSATGVASAAASAAATSLTGATGSRFGISVALGDVNGDGYADLAVGANSASSNFGAAYVFQGSATGVASAAASAATTTLTGAATSSEFGWSVALGDVNGDGYADLAVGAYAASALAGAAYVFHGSATGVASAAASSATTTLTGPSISFFGISVALGHVNGDGYADLAVGAYGVSASAGAAYVFHGSATGVASVAASAAATTLTHGTANNEFGYSVALGDVNGDGYADMAVGAYKASSDAGAAYVFHGSATGVASAASTAAATTLTGAAGSRFGIRVALGDVNGDGYADMAVGAHQATSNAGAAYVFHGSAAGVANGDYTSAATTLTGATNSEFGWSVALGDVNGDGHADLAVGARSASSLAGAAHVFHGSATGVASAAASAAATTLTGAASSQFGWSVAQ